MRAMLILIVCLSTTAKAQDQHAPTKDFRDLGKYLGSYDGRLKYFRWTLSRLDRAQLTARVDRPGNFAVDHQAPRESRANAADYDDSGYDRGHLEPANDHRTSHADVTSTNLYSNVAPQLPDFNRGVWKRLEAAIHDYALREDVRCVYVCTIPLFLPENGEIRTKVIGPNKVPVPTHFAKAVLVEYDTKQLRAAAVVIPHREHAADVPLTTFAVSVDALERDSGLDLWPGLDDQTEQRLEAGLATPPSKGRLMQITASTAAQLAAGMYRREGNGESSEEHWEARLADQYPGRDVEFAHSECAHAAIIGAHRHAVVAFRGTEPATLAHWKADFRGHWSADYGSGYVHSGYRRSLNSVWFAVARFVQRHAKIAGNRLAKGDRVTLIGHSKGGAEAVLAAGRFARMGYRRVQLLTFGAPRVGTPAYCRELLALIGPDNVHRFVNNNDLVPRLVTQWLLGFRHAGPAKYFASDGAYHYAPSLRFRLTDGIAGRWANMLRRGPDAIADHLAREYVARVTAAEQQGVDLMAHFGEDCHASGRD